MSKQTDQENEAVKHLVSRPDIRTPAIFLGSGLTVEKSEEGDKAAIGMTMTFAIGEVDKIVLMLDLTGISTDSFLRHIAEMVFKIQSMQGMTVEEAVEATRQTARENKNVVFLKGNEESSPVVAKVDPSKATHAIRVMVDPAYSHLN